MANPEKVVRDSASLAVPLRDPTFRNLLIADLVSDVGTFMQSVGAAWLMVSMHAGLIQTAASLPYFLLALPAGSAGDIFDRRRLVLFTEIWMMVVALILAILTIGGLTTPWLLLALTFAISAGDAFVCVDVGVVLSPRHGYVGETIVDQQLAFLGVHVDQHSDIAPAITAYASGFGLPTSSARSLQSFRCLRSSRPDSIWRKGSLAWGRT